MQPAKRGPQCNVQDVIVAIQNGESDFEMDSDDTDVSDEEAEDEVKKENQQATDCPAGHSVDIKPEPNLTIPYERYCWLKKDFISPNTDFYGAAITDDAVSLQTPLEYFQKFVSEDMIQSLTKNTNDYSFQKSGKSINTNTKEIEKVIGMYLKMGFMQMAGVRMYWETETRYPPVSDVMPRNRFQSLLTLLHFVDNLTVPEMEKKDKLWKIRPWLDSFRQNCLQVVPEEHNCVDEMIIPFKGKFSNIKQYMPGRPRPWGFKLWVRTGSSGMLCDFDVHQNGVEGIQTKSELGLPGDVMMKLASTLPQGQNYKIYADKYFTCIPLVVKLRDRGIHYVGTARLVNLPSCNLDDENSLKRKGIGSFDVRVEGNNNICAVKWYDNGAVTFVSSFAGLEPVQKMKYWDDIAKTNIKVERPFIVGTYNEYMGGVALLGSFAAKYKFPMKSRRWYLYIFWHTIILAVINAWLLYKRDCKALKISKKEILNRRQFQAQVASSLILVNTTLTNNGNPVKQTVISRPSVHPPLAVRKDQIGHFPVKTKRGRCRHCNKGYTNTLCSKCHVRLCFSEERNCLWEYHCQ